MNKQEKARIAFMEAVGDVQKQLIRLQNYFDNHMDTEPEEVTWGNVGNAYSVRDSLFEIIHFLKLEESKLTMEQLLERWKQFADVDFQKIDELWLFQEYLEKFECGQSFEMPAEMAFDHNPHIIG